jgi:hypothetical protein
LVERRPEKAGVASSILAPGTIHAAQSEQVPNFRGDVALPFRRQSDFLDVFGEFSPDDYRLRTEERV